MLFLVRQHCLELTDVVIGMRFPVVYLSDTLYAVLGEFLPRFSVCEQVVKDLLDCLSVGDIDQNAAFTVFVDVPYSSLVGPNIG